MTCLSLSRRLSGYYSALFRHWTGLTPAQVTVDGPSNHARNRDPRFRRYLAEFFELVEMHAKRCGYEKPSLPHEDILHGGRRQRQ